jgi:exopolyphosphatase/guanosine-5'-triphosphate,3'-diphosphate pyrophosphatase
MIVGAVDIGTNSMRLLIVDGPVEVHRETVVTGLGSDVDGTGRFASNRIDATVAVLERYGAVMDSAGVQRRRAVATSATRDADDGPQFVARAERALGVRPEIISGDEEAKLAFLGATAEIQSTESMAVVDIGGGSTEFVFGRDTASYAASVDLGSVRLSERAITSRPFSDEELAAAAEMADRAFSAVRLPEIPDRVIGIAGAFTSLSAIAMNLPEYDRERVHGSMLDIDQIAVLVERLVRLTLAETAAIPSLDPKRAPVILAGAAIAHAALKAIDASVVTVSERDLLDGLAIELIRA